MCLDFGQLWDSRQRIASSNELYSLLQAKILKSQTIKYLENIQHSKFVIFEGESWIQLRKQDISISTLLSYPYYPYCTSIDRAIVAKFSLHIFQCYNIQTLIPNTKNIMYPCNVDVWNEPSLLLS